MTALDVSGRALDHSIECKASQKHRCLLQESMVSGIERSLRRHSFFFFFFDHTAFKLNSLWHVGYLPDNLCDF
jgi:IS5 family transposase